MKLTTTLVSLLMVATGSALAGEVVVRAGHDHGSRTPKSVSRAFDSCVKTFIARTFPGQETEVNTKLTFVYDFIGVESFDRLDFAMQARLKQDGSKLAEGTCTVDSRARIISFPVRIAPEAKLAGLTPKDVQFAVVSR
jgi:hypothetical protein